MDRLKIVAWIVGGTSAVLFLVLMFAYPGGSDSPEPERELTPAERRQEMIEEQFSAWDGSHRELVQMVKDAMNDADSFEHIETRYRDDGETIYLEMRFRGANAFGGVVQNTAVATADPETGEILSVDLR